MHIETRTGRSLKVTTNHPIWTANGFVEAGQLEVGSFIALSRNNRCALQKKATIPNCQYKIVAFMLAEGGITNRSFSFTNTDLNLVREFEQALKEFHPGCSLTALSQDKYKGQYRVNGVGVGKASPIKE